MKGKEPLQGVAKTKRTREGGDNEPARKKTSEGPHLVDYDELREAAPVITQVSELRALQGEGSLGPSTFPQTQEGFRLLKSRRDLDSLAQEIQRASPLVTNLQLSNLKVGRFIGKMVLHRAMDFDTSQNIRRAATRVDDTLGHIGAHLCQVECR